MMGLGWSQPEDGEVIEEAGGFVAVAEGGVGAGGRGR